MATLRKRKGKKGTYYDLRWYEDGQRRKESLGVITKTEAETRLHAKEVELRTGVKVFSRAPMFYMLADQYLSWRNTQYPSSQVRIEQIINEHLVPSFRYEQPDQLSPLQVEAYKADRMAKVKPATVRKELQTLKAMLNWGVEVRLLQNNPIQSVKPPRSLDSRPIHWYTMEQLQNIYKGSHGDVWQFMANTGIRRGEVHLFEDKGEAIVIRSTAEARTKSGKWREIPLSGNARNALDALGGVIPLRGQNLSRAFRNDLPADCDGSLHSLRHTFATHQAMKGTPVKVLQALLGHANIATTSKYLHVAEAHLKQAINGFNI